MGEGNVLRHPAATLLLERQGLHEVEIAFAQPEPAVCLPRVGGVSARGVSVGLEALNGLGL